MQGWEPLSAQQKQAASVVEVFRIIEEVYIIHFKFSDKKTKFILRKNSLNKT